MKGLAWIVLACDLLLLSTATPVIAGISGESDSRFLVDQSRYGEAETSLEQWTSVYYKDLGGDLRMGLQFAVALGEEASYGRLYQSYLRTGDGLEMPELTLGRFESVDASGFTTLDGLALAQRASTLGWRLYLGKPRKIETYLQESADFLMGLTTQKELESFRQVLDLKRLLLNLGLEHRWSEGGTTLLHGGLSGAGRLSDERSGLVDFQMAADLNLQAHIWQRTTLDLLFEMNQSGQLRLGYYYYRPDEEAETFRDRFHGIYDMDRESILKLVWYMPKLGSKRVQLEVIGTGQQQGRGGQGMAAELTYPTVHGRILDGRVDYLEYGDDYVASTYLSCRQPLGAFSRFEIEGVYQQKRTRLSGKNDVWGGALSFDRRLRSKLFFSLNAQWLDHSKRENEYRLGLSLRYDFYQTNTGEMP
jgi:hypothetical protein